MKTVFHHTVYTGEKEQRNIQVKAGKMLRLPFQDFILWEGADWSELRQWS